MTKHHNMGSSQEQDDKIFCADQARNTQSRANFTNFEWAQISPSKTIVATEDHVWLYHPQSTDYFAQPMDCLGNIATTRKLLDGAIAAAKYAVNSDVRPPALTATRWVWRLAGQYHLCHPTPRLMEKASQQFASCDRLILADWAAEKIREERGHDLLALRDIQALGYDAEAVVKALIPPAAIALIDYFTRSARDLDPIDCVGYSYAMERLALGIDEQYIHKVETLLPQNTQSTRCLRVHSSIGADGEHVEETVEMVAGLTADERIRIVRACYETALMCFSPPPKGYISDAEIQQVLKPLKLQAFL